MHLFFPTMTFVPIFPFHLHPYAYTDILTSYQAFLDWNMSSFEVNFWNTAGYSAPNAVPTAPAYQAVPSGLSTTGGGGSIGVAYTQGSPDPLTAFSTQSVPSLAYPGYPAGAAPDPLDDPLFGTYQQSPFYTNGGVNTIRVYVDYVSGGPPSNWNICKFLWLV